MHIEIVQLREHLCLLGLMLVDEGIEQPVLVEYPESG